MKIYDLSDLLCEHLRELLSAEKQQHYVLEKVIGKTQSNELRLLIQKNIDYSLQQAFRLEDILTILGRNKRTIECKIMRELLDRLIRFSQNCANTGVLDAELISSLQCIKHFEISEYGTLCSYFSKLLSDNEVLRLLKMTITEEKALERKLTELAESSVNLRVGHSAFAAV